MATTTIPDDATPGNMHPAWAAADARSLIEFAIAHGNVVVMLAILTDPDALPCDSVPTSTHTLTVWRMAAPAPYVGREYRYTWPVLRDELGRYIGPPHDMVERWEKPW